MSESCSVTSNSFQPHGLYSPWNPPGQNTGVGSLSFLQGIFQPRDLTGVSCIAGRFFTSWATRETDEDTLFIKIIIWSSKSFPLFLCRPYLSSCPGGHTFHPFFSSLSMYFLYCDSPSNYSSPLKAYFIDMQSRGGRLKWCFHWVLNWSNHVCPQEFLRSTMYNLFRCCVWWQLL